MDYAVTITAREKAELLPTDPPQSPVGPKEIGGRTRATLISPGTELNAVYLGSRFPAVPGYAAIFEVDEVGAEVQGVRPGDLGFCMGRHASRQRVSQDHFAPVPAGLAPEKAVFARMMVVSMSTLTTTTARPPAKVVVTGLGLVGHLASKIFRASGYDVIACDPDEPRRDLAAQGGIETVLASVPTQDPKIAGQVSLVLECSGHEQALLDACQVVRKRGEVVCIGTPWQRRTDLPAHAIHHAIFHRYVVVRSGWEWELPLVPADFRENSIWGNCRAALKWLREGRISVDGTYEKVPPRECQRVYQDLLHRRPGKIAVVFNWDDCP